MIKMKRRVILKSVAAAGVLSALPGCFGVLANRNKPQRVLIMGGTGFIGPHMVRHLVAVGHEVTLFNRGKTNPHLFTELETIKGDRLTDDVKKLGNRQWDVVIDNSAFVPRAVKYLLNIIADNIEHYIFISTGSVYAQARQKYRDEKAPLKAIDDPSSEDVNRHYGALKVLCEQSAQAIMPGRVMVMRMGIVAGPGDHSDRFHYWAVKASRGGDIAVPGDGSDPVQFLDVRDLADWVVYCVQHRPIGIFNTISPPGKFTMGALIELCKTRINPQANFVWLSAAFLDNQNFLGARGYSKFPMWTNPLSDKAGMFSRDTQKAQASGLPTRQLVQSLQDSFDWFQTLPDERREQLNAGPSLAEEQQLLSMWRVQNRGK